MEIAGYNGRYTITKDGTIQSKLRKKPMVPYLDSRKKYLCVNFSIDYKKKSLMVHRLVALTYIPNPLNYKEVDHINRDTTDNRVENLRWATRSQNQINKNTSKNNLLGVKNIRLSKDGYMIRIMRNKLNYSKFCKNWNLEDAIIQRNLMWSMF